VSRGIWAICLLVAGGLAAGCSSSSSPPDQSGEPTMTARPTPTSTTFSIIGSPLTGLGALKSAWVAAHGGLNTGAFSFVMTDRYVYGFSEDIKSGTQARAEQQVADQLPSDSTIVKTAKAGGCFKVFYRSKTLARYSNIGPGFAVYYYTGLDGPYNSRSVDNVIVDNVIKNVAC
jgi:hypothetical protein